MPIATIVSIGPKKGQVVINSFDRSGKGTTETRHIKYDKLFREFVDRSGNVYRTLDGDIPTSRNRLVRIESPLYAF